MRRWLAVDTEQYQEWDPRTRQWSDWQVRRKICYWVGDRQQAWRRRVRRAA